MLVEDWLFSILLLVEGCVGFSEVVSISAEFTSGDVNSWVSCIFGWFSLQILICP